MKISLDLHRSHGVSDRRFGGGASCPASPPPRGDATGQTSAVTKTPQIQRIPRQNQGRIQDFSQGRAPSDALVLECCSMVYVLNGTHPSQGGRRPLQRLTLMGSGSAPENSLAGSKIPGQSRFNTDRENQGIHSSGSHNLFSRSNHRRPHRGAPGGTVRRMIPRVVPKWS